MSGTTTTDDSIEYGEDAASYVIDTWKDLGMGMVNVGFTDPWYTVCRSGGDYTLFLSVVDGTAVLIHDRDASAGDIPEEKRPRGAKGDVADQIGTVFQNSSGGIYPLPDDGVFEHGYKFGDKRKVMRIGLTDDTLTFTDE